MTLVLQPCQVAITARLACTDHTGSAQAVQPWCLPVCHHGPVGIDAVTGVPLPVSIVVPALNEAARIGGTLRGLRADFPDCELVVVDGGSTDGTPAAAAAYARVLYSPPGRARQLNEGARHTSGAVLWFVHADTRPEPGALEQLRRALGEPGTVGGGCSIRFDQHTRSLRFLAWASNRRARYLREIYGDQAMFVRRSVFDACGGFPELALMEDVALSHRLRGCGRLVLLPATVTASARRFREHGTIRMIVFMQYLKALYLLGVDPERIHRRYAAGPGWRPVRRGRAPAKGR